MLFERLCLLPWRLTGISLKSFSVNMTILSYFLATFLIVCTVAEDNWDVGDYYKREHSLTKPYQGSGWQVHNWDFYGSTIVSNDFVRLTADVKSQIGAIWNSVPVSMRNWEVQIQFKVHGKGKDLFGDGFVFWYSKERMMPGPVFGSKDYYLGLAVIVDTYSNHNGPHNHGHPYISAMINNGTLHYDHDRDGTHTQPAGCEAKMRNSMFDSWMSVRYENDVLIASIDINGEGLWQPCFRVEGVTLPTGYYFGLSAATGDLSDNHDIISVKTYELELPGSMAAEPRDNVIPAAQMSEPAREHHDDPKASSSGWSGIKIFFVMLCALIVIAAAVVIGMIIYQNHQQNSRKRFY